MNDGSQSRLMFDCGLIRKDIPRDDQPVQSRRACPHSGARFQGYMDYESTQYRVAQKCYDTGRVVLATGIDDSAVEPSLTMAHHTKVEVAQSELR